MQEKTLAELLHGIVALGIGAANIFVKNPESRQHAGQIVDLVNSEVLPLADDLLSQQAAANAAAAAAPPAPAAETPVKPAPSTGSITPGPVLVPSPAGA